MMRYLGITLTLLLGLAFGSFSTLAAAQAVPDQSTAANSEDAPATLPPAKFIYSTQYRIGKVSGYVVNPSTGALTSTGQTPVWAHWGPTKIASDSGGYRLYVANQGSQDVSVFFIYRNNGWLYPVPGTNFPVGGVSTDIAVHPSNKFVYVTTTDDYDGEIKGKSNSISAFSVASNGSLVAVKGSPFVTSGPNWGIAIAPNGKYLYASSQVSDKNFDGEINAFSINQTTGALTPIPGSPFPIIPYNCTGCFQSENIYGMTIDHTGTFLIGGGWYNGVIYVYRIQSGTGSLSEVAGSPFIEELPSGFPSAEPADVTVTPTDKYVFVDNDSYGALTMFDFDSSTGALSNMTTVPLPYHTFSELGDSVRSDPSGKFVYTLGYTITSSEDKPAVIGYAIGSGGKLTIVPNAPYPDPIDTTPNFDGIAVTP